MVYTHRQTLGYILRPSILDTCQRRQAVVTNSLIDTINRTPLRQEAREERIHLVFLAALGPQQENPLCTLDMGLCRLLIELEFQTLTISDAHKHRLAQKI